MLVVPDLFRSLLFSQAVQDHTQAVQLSSLTQFQKEIGYLVIGVEMFLVQKIQLELLLMVTRIFMQHLLK